MDVGMQLTSDQVLALAPDTGSAANGKKLAHVRHWRSLGQSPEAAWGECQGSALYQVRVDLGTLSVKCTCPSHKFPCKHGLGLLLLALDPKSVPAAEPPLWVAEWLAKRAAASQEKHERAAKTATAATMEPAEPAKEQRKRQEKREALLLQGLDSLDLWLADLVRNGLSGVEAQPTSFWERQAAQMVDHQAAGMALRLRQIAGIPGSSSDWPHDLLDRLGRLALLSHAYRHADTLDSALREDVRQLVGWNLKEEEVAERGEMIADDWLILGQHVEDEDRGRVQRTWLLGAATGRAALILQFSYMGQPFKESLVPGTCQHGELAYWPGASGIRARFLTRAAEATPLDDIPGQASVEAFLEYVAAALARQPWQERFFCALRTVTPIYDTARAAWWVRDETGAALPLAAGDHWRLLAVSGGRPVAVAGEWDGAALLPLGTVAERTYYRLGEIA
jgi:SWIM zinc finger